jgi:hypothetical protein
LNFLPSEHAQLERRFEICLLHDCGYKFIEAALRGIRMEVSDPSLGAWRAGLNFYPCFKDGGFSRFQGWRLFSRNVITEPAAISSAILLRQDTILRVPWHGRVVGSIPTGWECRAALDLIRNRPPKVGLLRHFDRQNGALERAKRLSGRTSSVGRLDESRYALGADLNRSLVRHRLPDLVDFLFGNRHSPGMHKHIAPDHSGAIPWSATLVR